MRNGSSKFAPGGTLYIGSDRLEFKGDDGKSFVIKCSEITGAGSGNSDKILTVKTTSGDHHFNDLVSIFSSSPSLKPAAEDIRIACKLTTR